MTPEQFWDGENDLPKYYRQADKIKRDRENFNAWLQGMYFYEALSDVSPVLRAFAKNGTKAHSYSSKPYELYKRENNVKKEKSEEKYDPGIAYMEMIMANVNKKFAG